MQPGLAPRLHVARVGLEDLRRALARARPPSRSARRSWWRCRAAPARAMRAGRRAQTSATDWAVVAIGARVPGLGGLAVETAPPGILRPPLELRDAISEHVARRHDRRARGLHPPDPVRRRPRADPAGPARPDARPHDAGPDLRPADRHGLCAQAGLLLRRQPRRRLAAPLPRRGRERLAAAARDRRALATPAWPTPTPPAPPNLPFGVLRGYAGTDLPEHNDAGRVRRLPVHRRAAQRRPRGPRPTSP